MILKVDENISENLPFEVVLEAEPVTDDEDILSESEDEILSEQELRLSGHELYVFHCRRKIIVKMCVTLLQ